MSTREAAGQAAFAVLCAFLGSEAGFHFFPLETGLAGLGLVLVHRSLPEAESRPRIPFLLPGLAGFALLCRWPDTSSRVAVLALVWIAGAIALPRNDRRRERLEAAAAVALLVGLFRTAVEGSAWLRLGYDGGALVVTEGIGRIAGAPFRGGPAAAGTGLLAPFLALAAVEAGRRTAGRRLDRWIPAAALLLAWIVTLAVLPYLQPTAWSPASAHPRDPAADWFRIAPPLFLLAFATCWILTARRLGSPTRPPGRLALASTAALLTAVLLLLPSGSWTGQAPPATRIRILGSDVLDFRSPQTGVHPLERVGMFGLLPEYLEGLGYRVEVRDDLPPDGMGVAPGVLVVINPVRVPGPERIRSIHDFVRRGGGLLVLGDHTDIFGTQDPLNSWCEPFGIRFRFDSARPASRHWEWSLGTVPHPSTAGLDSSNLRFRVGTGASLETRPPARALVLARYGFSDAGDRSNSGRGGFLGDYRWTGSERIGDIPLMAERRFGSGRVVALGDTSMFQNVALPFSLPFVSDLFRWLDPKVPAPGGWREEIAAVLLLAGGLGLLRPLRSGAQIAIALLLILPPAAREIVRSERFPDLSRSGRPVAVIDAGHRNGFSRNLWRKDSVAGLAMNLARAGYLPVLTEKACRRILPGESLRILIEPRTAPGAAERRALAGGLHEGLHLVLAVGPEGAGPCRPLLDAAGARILPVPLGPVPVLPGRDRESFLLGRKEPQFAGAWVMELSEVEAARIWHRAFDIPVAATRRGERGAISVISDPEFLLDDTLEAESDWWEGNVDLLRQILEPPGNEAGGNTESGAPPREAG